MPDFLTEIKQDLSTKNSRETCLLSLWRRYVKYQAIETRTWKDREARGSYIKALERLSTTDLRQPQVIIDDLLLRYGYKGFINRVKLFHDCCEWGLKKNLIAVNPFQWLQGQLRPINEDVRVLKLFGAKASELGIVSWDKLISSPSDRRRTQEAKQRGADFTPKIYPLWYKLGEPPSILMTTDKGYLAIRKAALVESMPFSSEIRRVMFDRSYLAALGVSPDSLTSDASTQVTLTIKQLRILRSFCELE